MSTALTVRQKFDSVKELLKSQAGALAASIPKGMDVDRLRQTVIIACSRNPALLDCDRASLIRSAVEAATLGLEVDGVQGLGYLVPFKGKVQFMPGYRGLIELARRSGQILTIEARVVYEGDAFEYSYGLNPVLRHTPGNCTDPEKLLFAYAVAHLKDGGYQFEVVNKAQVEAARNRSSSWTGGRSTPWKTDPAEMWKKTALRRLCKMLPLSAQDMRAVTKAEMVEAGVSPGNDYDPVTGEVPVPEDPAMAALDSVVEGKTETV